MTNRIIDEHWRRNYEDLTHVISFEDFEWNSQTYFQQELVILQPRLEALGYTEIRWLNGEQDSFGPLTRVCHALDRKGVSHWFIYG